MFNQRFLVSFFQEIIKERFVISLQLAFLHWLHMFINMWPGILKYVPLVGINDIFCPCLLSSLHISKYGCSYYTRAGVRKHLESLVSRCFWPWSLALSSLNMVLISSESLWIMFVLSILFACTKFEEKQFHLLNHPNDWLLHRNNIHEIDQ